MEEINIHATTKYSKLLDVLYVEDDLELQSQSRDLFEILFKSVTTADDGEEALNLYKKNSYDLVISDIEMPNMNGVVLSEKIKEISPYQAIIIISAHNDSSYLQTFINLNVNQFIAKPFNTEEILYSIFTVSKNIFNERMVISYKKELEEKNLVLEEKNSELESLVRILSSKIDQVSNDITINEIDFDSPLLLFKDEDIKKLKNLEIKISYLAVIVSLSKKPIPKDIKLLGELFSSYTNILLLYPSYIKITQYINSLASILNNTPEKFILNKESISILLEGFIYVLILHTKNIKTGDIKKAFNLHASMIKDINTIIVKIEEKKGEK